jgi:hypothetical protein
MLTKNITILIIVIMVCAPAFPDTMTSSTQKTKSPCNVDRSGFAVKSKAALVRETDAIAVFDHFRQQLVTTTFASRTAVLFPPSLHLTRACWKTFREHVSSFPGWHTKRRVATPSEKLAAKMNKKKGSVYFVAVSFDPLKAIQAQIKRASITPVQGVPSSILPTCSEDVTPVPQVSNSQVEWMETFHAVNKEQGDFFDGITI